MCNDIRFKYQLEKDEKYVRQELGSFCEQFGYPPLKATIYYSPKFLLNLKQIKTNTATLLSNFDYDHFKKEKKLVDYDLSTAPFYQQSLMRLNTSWLDCVCFTF